MSDRELINLYRLTESHEADTKILRETTKAIGTLSELTRLIEVRIEDLERRARELEITILANNLPDVIDGRGISVFVKGERGDEG